MELRLIIMALVCLSIAQVAFADQPQYHFANEQDMRRFYQLSKELRCNSCKNQTIADSNSERTIDIRAQLYQMIINGKSDQAIRDYLAYRYGDLVQYNGDSHLKSWVLWLVPTIMLLAAGWFSLRMYRAIRI